VHKNVFPTLTADESKAFSVVEPLDGSLFCHALVPFNDLRWIDIGGMEGRSLACWARTAYDRFGLTYGHDRTPDALGSQSQLAKHRDYTNYARPNPKVEMPDAWTPGSFLRVFLVKSKLLEPLLQKQPASVGRNTTTDSY
jgi:hypothetical protein